MPVTMLAPTVNPVPQAGKETLFWAVLEDVGARVGQQGADEMRGARPAADRHPVCAGAGRRIQLAITAGGHRPGNIWFPGRCRTCRRPAGRGRKTL